MAGQPEPLHTKGLVLHSQARYYDVLAWLLTLGRERQLRERLVELARVQPGESVLDVGCGTGTLAIAAKLRVGSAGTVVGIDASPEMVGRAKRKAAKARTDVVFQTAIVEALPFPDASFDVVLSTLMLHHLPGPVRERCVREVRRVLRPEGRMLAVDFAKPAREQSGLLGRLHRHGSIALQDIVGLLSAARFQVNELGAVGVSDLQYVLAALPRGGDVADNDRLQPVTRSLNPLRTPRWIFGVLILAAVVIHSIVFRGLLSGITLFGAGAAMTIGLAAIVHGGVARVVHVLMRYRGRRRISP